LFGAQRCDGSGWGYYVQMEGKKPYSSTLDGHCCLSSGPRGVALIPTFAVTTDADGVVMNFFDAGTARLNLRDGTPVRLTVDTRYPSDERIQVTIDPATQKTFAVKARMPAWCVASALRVNGNPVKIPSGPDGYVAITREWKPGDRIELRFRLEPRVMVGDHRNLGKVAVLYGPLVLAADQALLGNANLQLDAVSVAGTTVSTLAVAPEPAPEPVRSWPDAQVFKVNAIARQDSGSTKAGSRLQIRLIPFADAGATGTAYEVWVPLGVASSSSAPRPDGQ